MVTVTEHVAKLQETMLFYNKMVVLVFVLYTERMILKCTYEGDSNENLKSAIKIQNSSFVL
jgi:hypothetical protein